MYEQKNGYLENELRNQKKMNDFNEKSYSAMQNNHKKLLEENNRLQNCYQDVMRDLDKIRNAGLIPR